MDRGEVVAWDRARCEVMLMEVDLSTAVAHLQEPATRVG
jgi:hypothetical protein